MTEPFARVPAGQRGALDALFDSQPWGTIAVDREQRVLFATAAAARLLRLTIRAGTPFADLMRACGVTDFDGQGGEYAQEIEFQAGAAWLWLTRHAVEDSESIAVVYALVDITRMRRALGERMESLRFMSHDLRSPQNSIVALTQLHESDPQVFEACGGMARIAELARYALSIGDKFVLTSMESGLQPRDLARFDLCATVRSLIPQLDVAAVYRGVALRLWLAEGYAVWMSGVRVFVARALQNLVDNAIRASAPGNPVTVLLKIEDGYAVITVSDVAGGLPGLAAQRVMHDFDALAGQSSGAFGLGLKLTARIVQMHGGTLHAQANADAGTDFVMRLPCLTSRRGKHATPGATPGHGGFATLERPDAN
jgi:signal transduction histidine kinase